MCESSSGNIKNFEVSDTFAEFSWRKDIPSHTRSSTATWGSVSLWVALDNIIYRGNWWGCFDRSKSHLHVDVIPTASFWAVCGPRLEDRSRWWKSHISHSLTSHVPKWNLKLCTTIYQRVSKCHFPICIRPFLHILMWFLTNVYIFAALPKFAFETLMKLPEWANP